MKTLIEPDFWSDPNIEEIEAEEKLALLWLMTNSRRDLCGFVEISKRRFEFETALSFESLSRACEGVGKGFEEIKEGLYWVRNWVGKQIGRGEALKRNNVGKSMVRQLSKLPEALQETFLEEYPECIEMLEELHQKQSSKGNESGAAAKPLSTPPQGVGKGEGKDKDRIGKVQGEGVSTCGPMIEQIAKAYPKQSHFRETREAIAAAIDRAGGGEDAAQRILEGTKAIADKLREWSVPERQRYAPTPPNFFNGDRWADDPKAFESFQAELSDEDTPNNPSAGLGGRKARKVTDLRHTTKQ